MRPCSPAASFLLASTGLFVDDLLPSWPPPGYQGAAPSQMDTVSLRDDFSQRPIGLFSFWPALLWQCPRWSLVLAFAFSWQPLVSASGLALQRCFLHMPCLAILCRGLQCFGFCSSCFLSPACKLDAGGSLGQA